MAKSTLSFVCQNCGAAYNRWQGKCESCGEWNTLAEEDTTGSVPVSIRSKRRGRTFKLESLTGVDVFFPVLHGTAVRYPPNSPSSGRTEPYRDCSRSPAFPMSGPGYWARP